MSTIIVGGWVNETATRRVNETAMRRVNETATRRVSGRNRYAAGRRNRYAAVASQLSRYAASDHVSGTQIRGKFCRSGARTSPVAPVLIRICIRSSHD